MHNSDFIVFQSSQVLQIRLGFIANRNYKTFMSYKVFLFVFSFSSFSVNSFNFFVADGRKSARHAFILNNKRDARKLIQQKQKAGIVTSLNDTTLTKVTYGKYATRVPDKLAYGIFEWFSSQ